MAGNASPAEPECVSITLLGDLMLGRLVDQLLPTHVDEPEEAKLVSHFGKRYPGLADYGYHSPWGNALPLFQKSNLVLGNLETSATTHDVKWPNKVFNYRMHPDNVRCLTMAGVDYVSLANNHTLDYSKDGLLETVKTLKRAGIAFAGAGETEAEADSPAELDIDFGVKNDENTATSCKVHVYSYSDHPADWAPITEFNHLTYDSGFKQRLKQSLTRHGKRPSLKIVSIHWGPNYQWQPDSKIRDMAHFIIDECNADVIWGHSSHHIQGVEIYHKKLIIYGCGDFVDDYAVNPEYRNDLSAAWVLKVSADRNQDSEMHLSVESLEVYPNRIRHFQAGLLDRTDTDHKRIVEKFSALSDQLGTKVNEQLGDEGQIVVDLSKQAN